MSTISDCKPTKYSERMIKKGSNPCSLINSHWDKRNFQPDLKSIVLANSRGGTVDGNSKAVEEITCRPDVNFGQRTVETKKFLELKNEFKNGTLPKPDTITSQLWKGDCAFSDAQYVYFLMFHLDTSKNEISGLFKNMNRTNNPEDIIRMNPVGSAEWRKLTVGTNHFILPYGREFKITQSLSPKNILIMEMTDGPEADAGATNRCIFTSLQPTGYTGDFVNGMRHGRGTQVNENGTYTGDWFQDKMHGKGEYKHSNGDFYSGDFANNERSGEGKYTWAVGSSYTGGWMNGNRSGQGVMNWPNGDKYEGEWKENMRNGKGTFTYSDGSFYTGNWKNSEYHGQGIRTWQNGERYEGNWEAGVRSGEGSHNYADGSKYVGTWAGGFRSGLGVHVYVDGSKFEGFWSEGKYHGIGTMRYTNGDVYEGNWSNGLRHGQGTLTQSNGTVISGNWTDGESDIPQGEDRLNICDRGVVGDAIAKAIKLECSAVSKKKMAALTDLSLTGLNISTLPENAFQGLTDLRTLDLSHNNLSSIPSNALKILTGLHLLELSHNKITIVLADAFFGMSSLTRLWLNNNAISEIQLEVFFELKDLEKLDLSHNKLVKIPTHAALGLNSAVSVSYTGNPGAQPQVAAVAIVDTALDILHDKMYLKIAFNENEWPAGQLGNSPNTYWDSKCSSSGKYICRRNEYKKILDFLKTDNDGNKFVGDLFGYSFTKSSNDVYENFSKELTTLVWDKISRCDEVIRKYYQGTYNSSEYEVIKDCYSQSETGKLYSGFSSASHGTHIGGIVTNVDPKNKIFGVTKARQEFYASMQTAFEYVRIRKAPITNCSFGKSLSYYDEDEIAKGEKILKGFSDILFVFAAGNDSRDLNLEETTDSPIMAKLDNMITVANADSQGKLSKISSYGDKYVDVAAVGVNVISSALDNRMISMTGTSMATPYVSGVAASIYNACPHKFTPKLAKQIIMETCDKKSWLEGKVKCGGTVNYSRAVTAMTTYCQNNKSGLSDKKRLAMILEDLQLPVDNNEPKPNTPEQDAVWDLIQLNSTFR